MPDKRYEAEFNITGNASQELANISSAASNASGAIDEATKSTADSTVQTESFTDRLNKLKLAYDLVIGKAKEAVSTFAAEEASVGRLERRYRKAGASSEQLRKAEEKLLKNRDRLGASLAEQRDALGGLIAASGDAAQAEQDLALALDIAAQETISLEAASKILRKARNGDVGATKRLTGVTQDMARALNKVEGDAERGQQAIAALSDAYRGAAEELAGTEDRIAATQEQLKEVESAAGDIVVSIGDLTAALLETVTASEKGEFTLSNFAGGMSEFADSVREAKDVLVGFLETANSEDFLRIVAGGGILSPGNVLDTIADVEGRRAANAARARNAEKQSAAAAEAEAIRFQPAGSARTTPAGIAADSPLRSKELDEQIEKEEKLDQAKRKSAAAERKKTEAAKKALEIRNQIAAALLAGNELAAERIRILNSNLTPLEKELALKRAAAAEEERLAAVEMEAAARRERADELAAKNEERERELELRDQIAQLKLEGRNYEAERIRIENANLTTAEKALAQQKLANKIKADEKKADEEIAAARLEAVEATGSAAKGIIGIIAGEEAAKRAAALVDGLIYQYKAIAAFSNPATIAQGVQLQTAALSAFAVAGSGGGGGGGGGGGKKSAGRAAGTAAPPNQEAATRRSAKIFAEEQRKALEKEAQPVIINYRSVSRPTEAEGRVLGETVQRAQSTIVGGGRIQQRI